MENEIKNTEVELDPIEDGEIVEEESSNGGLLIGIGIGAIGTLGLQWLHKKAVKPLTEKVGKAVADHKAKKAAKKAETSDEDSKDAE